MTGKSVSHYRILEKLGRGDRGEVYLAQDSRWALYSQVDQAGRDLMLVENFQRGEDLA
jgi:hypothetical protein